MIEQGQCAPDDVLRLIEDQGSLWLRVAAARDGDEWAQSVLEVTSGAAPPRWNEQRWEYEDVVFLTARETGKRVAEWLRTQVADIDGLAVKLPPIADQVSWQRRASQTVYTYETLQWPHVLYELTWQTSQQGPGSGALIGPSAPSYVRFANAAAAFFGVPLGPGGSFDNVHPGFRHQDLSGRIVAVRLRAAGVEVEVEGDALEGAVVELACDWPGPAEALSGEHRQVVHFPLGEGLPNGAWVVLKRDHAWIDRKFLNWPHTATPDPGVEVVVEPRSQLDAFVFSGEGSGTEFKIELPTTPDARRKVARTVAAFASGEGGSILFGVRNEDGAILGLPANDTTQAAQDAITNFVRSLVTPLPDYTVERFDLDDVPGRAVLVLTVEAGGSPPYGVDPANPRYFVRRGGTTFPASSEQVRALARSRPAVAASTGYPFGLFAN